MRSDSEKADTQFSVPRVRFPRKCSKAEEVGNYQYTSALMGKRLKTVFRTIISVHQLSIHGAVSDLWEEYKACHVRTVRLVMAGQTDPLFEPASL